MPILGRVRGAARTAVVLTGGNEIVSGDVENTNASWLARRLPALGLEVKLIAAVPAAVAEAFGVDCVEIPAVAQALRVRFEGRGLGDYAARWACLPRGAEPLENPLGGAPGFVLENVLVFPGLPREMEAMFESVAEEFRQGQPIGSWRRRYR